MIAINIEILIFSNHTSQVTAQVCRKHVTTSRVHQAQVPMVHHHITQVIMVSYLSKF